MKKHTKRKHYNPHRAPIWRGNAMRAMARELREKSVAMLMADHGSEQRELLAYLAKLVGVGSEVAARLPVEKRNAHGLHHSLAIVVQMACDGDRWDSAWAAQLATAADLSADLLVENGDIAAQVFDGAHQLAARILAGTLRPDAIEPVAQEGALA
ncbi:hypothetical protein EZI45_19200 [Delftia tsuruhatensis]|uniref:Uncharacterized protein n=1 Tax=Delftia lacustris TaxID=558537 RepID=A0A7T2YNA1_9BURK|nr:MULTISPECIES: hypothetical protein [Delftia]QPS78581.1 hypothetical protein I6G47_16225 [Delftia lacustris]TDF26248.1 hypothetical protein EZI45_19200 [Delftia tsuruhatensis]